MEQLLMGMSETYSKRNFQYEKLQGIHGTLCTYLLTLKGSPAKNPPKIKLTPRVHFCLTFTVRIYPCIDFHFLFSICSEHSYR